MESRAALTGDATLGRLSADVGTAMVLIHTGDTILTIQHWDRERERERATSVLVKRERDICLKD